MKFFSKTSFGFFGLKFKIGRRHAVDLAGPPPPTIPSRAFVSPIPSHGSVLAIPSHGSGSGGTIHVGNGGAVYLPRWKDLLVAPDGLVVAVPIGGYVRFFFSSEELALSLA